MTGSYLYVKVYLKICYNKRIRRQSTMIWVNFYSCRSVRIWETYMNNRLLDVTSSAWSRGMKIVRKSPAVRKCDAFMIFHALHSRTFAFNLHIFFMTFATFSLFALYSNIFVTFATNYSPFCLSYAFFRQFVNLWKSYNVYFYFPFMPTCKYKELIRQRPTK